MRTETAYNKEVNYDKESGEIIVLGSIFSYTKETEYATGVESVITMQGATGNTFEVVSRDQFNETIEPYLNEPKELLKYYVEQGLGITVEMIDNIDDVVTEEGLKKLFFDLSYDELWDYLREELNLSEEEAYIFNCVGGGRCFDSDFEGNINPELSAIIREFESKI
jgi:hypothetical protein